MKRITFLFVLTTAGMASAEPCVGNGYDVPFPGANNTNMVYVDVPSARAPSHWQEGQLEGHFYRVYSNLTADLSSGEGDPTWKISIDCQDSENACNLETRGTPPAEATKIVEQIDACLRGVEVKEEVSLIHEPMEVPEPPVLPCGLAAIDEQEPVRKLQRLVTLAGNDVGKIDGIYGPKTENAILKELPEIEIPIDIEKATVALDEKLCLTAKTSVPPEA